MDLSNATARAPLVPPWDDLRNAVNLMLASCRLVIRSGCASAPDRRSWHIAVVDSRFRMSLGLSNRCPTNTGPQVPPAHRRASTQSTNAQAALLCSDELRPTDQKVKGSNPFGRTRATLALTSTDGQG